MNKTVDEQVFTSAEGLLAKENDTNPTLAARDYSVPCHTADRLITVVHGYHIWWCKNHYQPLAWCNLARHDAKALDFAQAVIRTDKTRDYEYGGEKSQDSTGTLPPVGARWLSPRELARDFIKALNR